MIANSTGGRGLGCSILLAGAVLVLLTTALAAQPAGGTSERRLAAAQIAKAPLAKAPLAKAAERRARSMGFAWAHEPSAASYRPSPIYAYNSAGGPIEVKRTGVGQYVVTFAGLDGDETADANVQVISYGAISDSCQAVSWSAAADGFTARVRCIRATGAPADTPYAIVVTW